jgi:protein-disulfide isomerase
LLAAKYVLAAWLQDKFWEMHDILISNQDEWSGHNNAEIYFARYLSYLRLDLNQFTRACPANPSDSPLTS